MPDRRADSAVGHITVVAPEPIEHGSAAFHEHLKFLCGLRDMNRERPMPATGGLSRNSQQFWLGGVGGVRAETGAAASSGQSGDAMGGILQDGERVATAFYTRHLQQGHNAERRR